jgi:RimJ/RimL family protein N-acetyltransferase
MGVDLYALPDGARVAIRPIGPDDGERLRQSHARLSPESRYRRFLASKPELSTSDTRYLVEVDGNDHFALVATRPDEPGEPIVAVARYIRFEQERDVAEFAIVVGDDYQRQGLGVELMRRLGAAAVANGITRFRATMLADNIAIQRVSHAIADGPVRRRFEGSLLEVELDLPGAVRSAAEVIPFPERPESPEAAIIAG